MAQNQLAKLFPRLSEVPDDVRLKLPIDQAVTLVGGELRPWRGKTRKIVSPVCIRGDDGALTQLELGSIPVGTGADVDAALEAAALAYDNGRGIWPTMTVAGRIAAVEKFTAAMIGKRHEISRLMMWEIGKSLVDSEKEFDRTIDYIRATITALKELDNGNSRFTIVEGTIGQIRRTPLGVVLCMGPYNYPLNETFTTLIPALIMGNTVVFKPPAYGLLLFSYLLESFRDAFPKGVVNTAYGRGSEIVPRLLESGKVSVLALIGSSRVAGHLKKLHPKTNRLRAILRLDAKNAAIVLPDAAIVLPDAAIVLPDADIDLAVKECLTGALSFNGQRCTALKMLIVHRSIADDFLVRLTKAMESLKRGMPWEKGVAITPLPEDGKIEYLTDCLRDAEARGARVINEAGGTTAGTFFEPAIVYPVAEGMKLYREEQFGPIVAVMPFDDIDTALDYIVTSEHGQQVSLFSSNPDLIGRLVDPLVNQVCRVNINCQCQRGPDVFPFTGRKDSAEGTLSVTDALRSFSIRSMIAAKQTEESKRLIDDIVQHHKSNFINTRFLF